jgi:hypothetical protein
MNAKRSLIIILAFMAAMLSSMVFSSPKPAAAQEAECTNHGTLAWQNDNQTSGEPYGEAPVGGLDEACGVVGQTWWVDAAGVSHRATFYVPPHTVVWLSGHKGGTGWYWDPSQDAKANLAEQMRQLEERDGPMDSVQVMLPSELLAIMTRYSSKAAAPSIAADSNPTVVAPTSMPNMDSSTTADAPCTLGEREGNFECSPDGIWVYAPSILVEEPSSPNAPANRGAFPWFWVIFGVVVIAAGWLLAKLIPGRRLDFLAWPVTGLGGAIIIIAILIWLF